MESVAFIPLTVRDRAAPLRACVSNLAPLACGITKGRAVAWAAPDAAAALAEALVVDTRAVLTIARETRANGEALIPTAEMEHTPVTIKLRKKLFTSNLMAVGF